MNITTTTKHAGSLYETKRVAVDGELIGTVTSIVLHHRDGRLQWTAEDANGNDVEHPGHPGYSAFDSELEAVAALATAHGKVQHDLRCDEDGLTTRFGGTVVLCDRDHVHGSGD